MENVPLSSKVASLQVTTPVQREIIVPEQYQKLFYNQGDDTYYGGRLQEQEVKKRQTFKATKNRGIQ